ncbi:cell filamentation protein Fic [Georgenia muralis]
MSSDVVPALERLALLDGVPEAAARAREAAADLRWHEALRRRWREARAEAAVRSAVAGASLDGARAPASWLRGRVAAGDVDPAAARAEEAAVLAAWRAQVHAGALFGDLGGRAPRAPGAEVMAGLHRDLTAHLVAAGALQAGDVGRPRTTGRARDAAGADEPVGAELEARTALVVAVLDAERAPGLVRAGVVHAEVATARPFVTANGQLARVLARLVLVRSGVDPTGVALPDEMHAGDPLAYRRALAAYATGTPDGVATWLVHQAEAVTAGARAGAGLATGVLAGRPA